MDRTVSLTSAQTQRMTGTSPRSRDARYTSDAGSELKHVTQPTTFQGRLDAALRYLDNEWRSYQIARGICICGRSCCFSAMWDKLHSDVADHVRVLESSGSPPSDYPPYGYAYWHVQDHNALSHGYVYLVYGSVDGEDDAQFDERSRQNAQRVRDVMQSVALDVDSSVWMNVLIGVPESAETSEQISGRSAPAAR